MKATLVKREFIHQEVVKLFVNKTQENEVKARRISSVFVQKGESSQINASNIDREKNGIKNLEEPFFTEKVLEDMALGKIPNMAKLHHNLSGIKAIPGFQLSAINFLPALREFSLNDQDELERFLHNPETNHVLVHNEHLKMVLIRWEPGASSNIHGHAVGGCVFKVLHGEISEKRYSADDRKELISENFCLKDNIAYIDDMIGLHSVENPNDTPAITLHLYTPGNYQAKK